MIERLKVLESTILSTLKQVLAENDYIIVEMNSEDQLFEKGIDRNGIEIASYAPYSAVTVQLKKLKGQPTTRVTLRDEGDFHFSFFLELTSTGMEIKASNWKTEHLVQGYGEQILGLTDYNFQDLARNYVFPAIMEEFKKL